MQNAKKYLLGLIFSLNFMFVTFYPVMGVGDIFENNYEEIIAGWSLFGVFGCASVSSLLGMTKTIEKFGILKIPALIIFPLSIPYLILDYFEPKEEVQKKEEVGSKDKKVIFLAIVIAINLCLIFAQLGIIIPIAITYSAGVLFFLIIPLFILIGSVFLLLNFFHSNICFKRLAGLGGLGNGIYLNLEVIENKQINYFFNLKTKKTKNY